MNRLTKELISLHNKEGLRAEQWFSLMVDDVLAGFGLKLKEIPSPEVTEVLFNLSGIYANELIKVAPFSDLLSVVYMDLASNYQRSGMGQFFTPESVCRLMAQISIGSELVDLASEQRLMRFSEPAVGAGGMVLAFLAEVLLQQGPEALRWVSVTGVDLDRMCSRMYPCQVLSSLLVNQLQIGELISYHGNTLGDPREWATVCHYSRADLPEQPEPADHPLIKERVAEAIGNPLGRAFTKTDQLALFE